MLTLSIEISADEARKRLDASLHRTRALWFVGLDARSAWIRSSAPLYIRWISTERALIGPRLGSPDVSRFCPCWSLTLHHANGVTEARTRWSLDPITSALGLFWTVMLCASGVFVQHQIGAGLQPPAAMAWWAFLVASAVGVAVVSAWMGGKTLASQENWLREVLTRPALAEEWVDV